MLSTPRWPRRFSSTTFSEELDGDDECVIDSLRGFTQLVAKRIHADGMEVSDTKSVVSPYTKGLDPVRVVYELPFLANPLLLLLLLLLSGLSHVPSQSSMAMPGVG